MSVEKGGGVPLYKALDQLMALTAGGGMDDVCGGVEAPSSVKDGEGKEGEFGVGAVDVYAVVVAGLSVMKCECVDEESGAGVLVDEHTAGTASVCGAFFDFVIFEGGAWGEMYLYVLLGLQGRELLAVDAVVVNDDLCGGTGVDGEGYFPAARFFTAKNKLMRLLAMGSRRDMQGDFR